MFSHQFSTGATFCNDIFAGPMLNTQEDYQEYWKQVVDLEKKGLLPRLDVYLPYKVYSIQGSKFGAHKSIVLTTDDEHFVTVELGFIHSIVDGKKHVYPVTQQLPKIMKSNMEYHGKIIATGTDLIGKAVAVMKQFGSYFKFCHNCQHFCNMYLEVIGLKQAQTLTDGDKLAVGLTVPIIIACLLFLLLLLRRR